VTSETLLILNPASGRGAAGRMAEELVARAEASCGPLVVASTGAPGDAARLARAAADRRAARILVAGGDGTLGEVVTGLLTSSASLPAERPSLGLLPVGSGCDFARTLGLPRNVGAALEVIAAGHVRLLDAGRVESGDKGGGRQVRHFANEVSAGLSGDTVMRVHRYSPRLGPRLGFLLGAVSAVSTHEPFEASVEVDGELVHEGAISLFAAANGCYFGAGMRVAPNASLDDGLLEVVVARGLSRPEILAHLPSFYLGRHGRHPGVSFHAARVVRLIPIAGQTSVEADGEAGLALPLRIECIPGALRVFTPAVTIPVTAGRTAPVRAAPRMAVPVGVWRDRA
jgi:YegS/Rv2252/BmrU family lipid kinase